MALQEAVALQDQGADWLIAGPMPIEPKKPGRVASSFLAIGSMRAGRMLDAAGRMLAGMLDGMLDA